MRSRSWIGAAAALATCWGCGAEGPTNWRLVSMTVDGEPFPTGRALYLETSGDTFRAETTCNSVSGPFGGNQRMTTMACGADATEVELGMMQALRVKPQRSDDRLVFQDGSVELVYEPFAGP